MLLAILLASFALDRSAMSDAYWKVWNDAEQARIDADIEANRKADARFEVEAPDGTEVKVEQIGSSFYFGAHAFNFDQLGTTERNRRYRELFGTVFNSATVAFYWKAFEPYPGCPRFAPDYGDSEAFWNSCEKPKEEAYWRRPAADGVVNFMRSRGVRVHGHTMIWSNFGWSMPRWIYDQFCPENEKKALGLPRARDPFAPPSVIDRQDRKEWIHACHQLYKKYTPSELAQLAPKWTERMRMLFEKRVTELCRHYGDRIASWDVVNESCPDWQRLKNAVTGEPLTFGGQGIMPGDYACAAFRKAAAELPPEVKLNINDFVRTSDYPEQVRALLDVGCKIDVAGIQMHLFNPKYNAQLANAEIDWWLPSSIRARIEPLVKLGLPVHVSEITIPCNAENDALGRMRQAVAARDLYRLWFSTKGVCGITWWNLVDDCGAPGEPLVSGLFTRDMQPKPAYHVLEDLILREWRTNLTVPVQNGKVAFRGFCGAYRLSWKRPDGTIISKTMEVL